MDARKPQPEPPAIARTADAALRIDSQQLLLGQRTIEIDHSGQRYTLRVTRENKLILTK
ncbi:MAG: hemin uptake protein HemP [Rhodocyclaceae bacterium]